MKTFKKKGDYLEIKDDDFTGAIPRNYSVFIQNDRVILEAISPFIASLEITYNNCIFDRWFNRKPKSNIEVYKTLKRWIKVS